MSRRASDEAPDRSRPSERIKLLQLVLQLDLGGAESIVCLHALHLERARFDVHVWSLDTGGANVLPLEAAGIPVRVFGKGLGVSLGFLRAFREALRAERFDVIHAHNDAPARWAALGVVGARRRPALVRTEHTFHEDRRATYALDHAATGAFFDADLGVCETITRSHQAIDPLWRRRYRTLPNAIDVTAKVMEPAQARVALGIASGRRTVLNLGNLRSAKGQRDLVTAFATVAADVPDVDLLVIGEGPLRGELESQVARAGLTARVRFTGHRTDAAELLAAADVVVQASIREGMPISLLEAARARRAIVATDVGGTKELIVDGQTGWLVPPSRPATLAVALTDALRRPEESSRRAEAAHGLLLERHDVRRVVRRAEALYEELVERRFKAGAWYRTSGGS